MFIDKQSWFLTLMLFVCILNAIESTATTTITNKDVIPSKLLAINNDDNNNGDEKMEKSQRDNEYHSMKRAFDIFNDKMEFYMAFYMNELTLLTRVLDDLKGKMQTIEIIHHEVDQLIEHRNIVDQKLASTHETTTQSFDNRLERMEYSIQYLRVRIDDLVGDKQRMPTEHQSKENGSGANNGDQLTNCESKIDHLISFVHNFAELDRLESSDVLNRLGNMQSQLIDFFDAKEGTKQRPKHNEAQLMNVTDTTVISVGVNAITTMNPFNVTSADEVESETLKNEIVPLQRRKRKRSRSKRNRSDNECEEKLRNCQMMNNPKNEIDIDYGILKPNKPTVAKYHDPSQYGCHQFVNLSRSDGVYHFDGIPAIRTPSGNLFNERKCSFDSTGLAWTIIQSRGCNDLLHLNFNRSWNEYKYGFGNLNTEFWYGNDFIHRLTYDDDMELKIELESWDERRIEFEYEVFRVDSESNYYNLFVSGFRGNDKSLDALKYHNNQDFSTFDRQHDKSGIDDRQACCSCAKSYSSGWWFNNCIEANLNGVYQLNPRNNNYIGIVWEHWLGDYSLKSSKMMIRPKVGWSETDIDGSSKPPDDP